MNMERDCVEELRLIIASAREGSQFVLYDDDGRTNDFEKGIFRKTTVSVSGTDVVKVDFTAEGDYRDTVKSVTVEIIRKDRSPFWAALGGQRLEHYLNHRKFEAADSGWYYSQTKKAVLVKYANPKKDAQLVVSFEDFDLIGM